MNTPKTLGDLLRRMADEEEREVEQSESMRLPPSMRYPFGSKEAYVDWLKRSGRWFGA